MTLLILSSFLIPLYFFVSVTSKPAPRKIKQGKVYSVVLLDKDGQRIKAYTYIK